MIRFTVVPNAATDSQTVPAFGCGPAFSGLTVIDRKTYSADDVARGDMLRTLRKELDLTLGEVARALGLSPADVSGAEFGRCRIEPMNKVGDVLRAVAVARTRKAGAK